MKDRTLLSSALHKICDNVYFQPGTNTTIKYPCIEYSFEGVKDIRADNKYYLSYGKYQLINIYKTPSSKAFDKIREIFPEFLSFDRQYISDGLYHDAYTLYW